MELKPGYKLTEVGVIPEDWDAGNLGKFWSVTDCKHLTAEFVPSGIPIASIREVQSRFVDLTNAKQTTMYFYKLLIEGGRKPQPGDLILSRNATVGEIAQVADWHPHFAMGQDVCLLRKKSSEFSTEFIQAVFQSPVIAAQLSNLMVGSTFKRANIEQIRNFAVPMPPPVEQRTVATALSDIDELLGALDRLIAKKRDLKQAAMQQLLTGKTRLPGFSGDWEETTLGDIGECIIGLTYKPEDVVEHGLLVLRSSNIQNGQLAYHDNVYVNIEVSNHLVTRIGDILVCVRNGSRALIGKCAVIDESAAGLTFGAFMSVYRTKYWRFIAHAFQSSDIQRQIRDNIGATINQITNKDMKAFRVMLPPEDEQIAIATILSDMDDEIASLEQRRDKTRVLKQAMMQELLTGRTRLL